MSNHRQTLERLAERGGLSPGELVAVMEGRDWRSMPIDESLRRLEVLIAAALVPPDVPILTVGALQALLDGLPADMPVFVDGYESGIQLADWVLVGPAFYVAPTEWEGSHRMCADGNEGNPKVRCLLISRKGSRASNLYAPEDEPENLWVRAGSPSDLHPEKS